MKKLLIDNPSALIVDNHQKADHAVRGLIPMTEAEKSQGNKKRPLPAHAAARAPEETAVATSSKKARLIE